MRQQLAEAQQENKRLGSRINEIVSTVGVVYHCDPTGDGTPPGWRNDRAERAEAERDRLKRETIKLTHDVENAEAFSREHRKQLLEAESRLSALTTALSALIARWRREAALECRVSFSADDVEALFAVPAERQP